MESQLEQRRFELSRQFETIAADLDCQQPLDRARSLSHLTRRLLFGALVLLVNEGFVPPPLPFSFSPNADSFPGSARGEAP